MDKTEYRNHLRLKRWIFLHRWQERVFARGVFLPSLGIIGFVIWYSPWLRLSEGWAKFDSVSAGLGATAHLGKVCLGNIFIGLCSLLGAGATIPWMWLGKEKVSSRLQDAERRLRWAERQQRVDSLTIVSTKRTTPFDPSGLAASSYAPREVWALIVAKIQLRVAVRLSLVSHQLEDMVLLTIREISNVDIKFMRKSQRAGAVCWLLHRIAARAREHPPMLQQVCLPDGESYELSEMIYSCMNLPRLYALSIEYSESLLRSADHTQVLKTMSFPSQLKKLILFGCTRGIIPLDPIARHNPSLTDLRSDGDVYIEDLALLTGLRVLDVGSICHMDPGSAAIAQCRVLPQLEVLSTSGTWLPEWIVHATRLTKLKISIRRTGFVRAAQCPGFGVRDLTFSTARRPSIPTALTPHINGDHSSSRRSRPIF